jgi:hypothetical protein
LSFNGGKDATLVLVLAFLALADHHHEILQKQE